MKAITLQFFAEPEEITEWIKTWTNQYGLHCVALRHFPEFNVGCAFDHSRFGQPIKATLKMIMLMRSQSKCLSANREQCARQESRLFLEAKRLAEYGKHSCTTFVIGLR